MNNRETKIGAVYTLSAYFMWGLFPLYWIPIHQIPALEILAHRIFWSLIFMLVLLAATHSFGNFKLQLKKLFANAKLLLFVFVASVLITFNWLVYIWAVNNGHVIESSMGYYINPLISILLGIIFLKEKLTMWQLTAFSLAAIGVVIQTVNFGQVPWIAVSLALSFGFYGLAKKLIHIAPSLELTFETLFIVPAALIYLIFLQQSGSAAFGTGAWLTTALLIGTGIVTAVPLLFFAEGAQRISLTMVGFFQYITPTMQLIIGVVVYQEPFHFIQLLSFSFIWLGLLVFTLSATFSARKSPALLQPSQIKR
ncbi:EamA family transporter RarD [Sporolactobacillus shoreicorticis]|uniref:EamA family transporter RarD n=1 Tax=Sporolactobacillus shoreicorticis TaxID=1923877 RepID=A0ABW5S6N3_9BACL|nr:EamA family transporter RarD [Sporolactobacillus shoreicorticis]MCO7125782.1 EamA family transporter RarD [Sporolactobacillus shoreicorticis]